MVKLRGFSSLFVVLALILIASALVTGWLRVLSLLIVFMTILFVVIEKLRLGKKRLVPDWFYTYQVKRRCN